MRIEILTAPGCPHAASAKEMVSQCLATLGVDVPVINRVGRYASPTVLVDGVDVMRAEQQSHVGDACRLDLPTPQRLLSVLANRR
jgi:predicted Fe-Mo cluster-binding NifX family protein